MTSQVLDLAGAGIGPFNLSLAAQLDSIPALSVRFFEKRPSFAWHPGMMLPGAEMQTSILKDLVTATNPTSPWSFLSYLVAHKRFYQFINAEYEAVPRKEFADYLGWVARGLTSLRFGTSMRDVQMADGLFSVATDNTQIHARNLSVGVGKIPARPAWAERLPKSLAFHSSEAALRLGDLKAPRVAVIGGGQSGAEIVDALMDMKTVASIHWLSRRPNFEPLDATPFTNELFTPGYMERFHGLPEDLRLTHTRRQVLASDGVSPSTLKKLYRRLYERKLDGLDHGIALRPYRDVISALSNGPEIELTMRNGFDDSIETIEVDMVVLATGYRFVLPDFLQSLQSRIAVNSIGEPVLESDFSVAWDGPPENKIFVLNGGRNSHGIAEPQLSLAAWRSAVIANALLDKAHFDLDQLDPIVQWESQGQASLLSAHMGQAAE
ncbi:lysine N(6)-hydroxylase/L-ornithine N(5)-oxygenase family protein [Agrobacterium sp. SHOUNA12C]|uniref:Siderophore biosynthesis protein n=1 Tax=Rhizobium rhizogenes NBRC 13257 TaxID=1220581 RepID=A0AA87U4N5_RHIRH|nr:lysine N(6)-hydroxylase/L-ornithine N(5)-oxygenase family protein [Rhizobium rhizogenes]MCJ9720596.1 lysine N(6)-hydroxylase/L-ornithine N(5)-oxygenase family protein [Agrobacterium sp. BETTINA12B]MCJ9758567.1 lysine N(6)-hydroxylase/L-ornithine N(5)-oxygenase family protein [Agrobacterium sp. SHOUNA12C]NTF51411.1 lysine N(6)-hydroxylase/L-ornithine N(5)-oxygenase family protein [Rhizobium rhizogenes]NTF57945.1 lysine N(6)-hydroxylase/L-ornithine N(5)-oxygenase family protein [Rhizobium rhiz